jgi:hypothetical protein
VKDGTEEDAIEYVELLEQPICAVCDQFFERADEEAKESCVLCKRNDPRVRGHWRCRGPHPSTLVAIVYGGPSA